MALIEIAVAIIVLFLIKKFFAGGRCKIQKDLSNQIVVVTGGNSGIGKQTVRKMAEFGCKAIIGARDTKRSQKVVEQFKNLKGPVISFQLDLEDRNSIQQFVKNVKKQIGDKSINYLVNNAGVYGMDQKEITKTGFEMHMGINYFGHFYLTYLLWDALKKAGNPRIINVSSMGYKFGGKSYEIDFQNLNFQNGGYQPMKAYCRSKKANILFTKQLQQKMNEAKINGISVSVHPGFVNTQIIRYRTRTFFNFLKQTILFPLIYIFIKTSKEGAQTTLYTLLERQDKLVGGSFYVDCKIKQIVSEQCLSKEVAKKLWQISQDAFGIKFVL